MNQAIQQVDQVVQENAAASEEISSTAEELSAQADTLRLIIRKLIKEQSTIKTEKSLFTGGHLAQSSLPPEGQMTVPNGFMLVKKTDGLSLQLEEEDNNDGFIKF